MIPKFFNLLWPSADQMKLGPGTLKMRRFRTLFDLLSTPSGSRARLIAAAVPLKQKNDNHFSDQQMEKEYMNYQIDVKHTDEH